MRVLKATVFFKTRNHWSILWTPNALIAFRRAFILCCSDFVMVHSEFKKVRWSYGQGSWIFCFFPVWKMRHSQCLQIVRKPKIIPLWADNMCQMIGSCRYFKFILSLRMLPYHSATVNSYNFWEWGTRVVNEPYITINNDLYILRLSVGTSFSKWS